MKTFLHFGLVCALMAPLSGKSQESEASQSATAKSSWLSSWESIGEQEGITGRCRQHVSKINQCRLTSEIDADLSTLTALLLDGNGVASWAPNTISSVSLTGEYQDNEVAVYATYNFPGASNRDAVIHSVAEQNPLSKVVKIKFKSVDVEGPKKDLRLVRFPLVAGSWTLTPIGKGRTRVEHLNLSLPGGVVQDNLYMLYNLGLKQASFDTILALKKAVTEDQYQQAELTFIENFQ